MEPNLSFIKIPENSGYFLLNLNSNSYLSHNAGTRFRAASLIKLPILWAYLISVAEKKLDSEANIEINKEIIVPGTGVLKDMQPGAKILLRNIALLMISESDNTATNILINLLGFKFINSQIQELGMQSTELKRKMQDFESAAKGFENYTTPSDIGNFLLRIAKGININNSIENIIFKHLQTQNLKNKFPYFISKNIVCAHKTGELPGLEHDAGIIVNENNVVIAVAMSEGLSDNNQGVVYCREIGKIAAEWAGG